MFQSQLFRRYKHFQSINYKLLLKSLHSEPNKDLKKTLMEILDISNVKFYSLLRKHKKLNLYEPKTAIANVTLLKNAGFTRDQILKCSDLLELKPDQIESRTLLLKEFGFDSLNNTLILRYFTYVKKRVSLFKSHKWLKAETKPSENLYSYLEPPPNTSPLPVLSDNNTVLEVYTSIRFHYLYWKLEFTNEEDLKRIFHTYSRIKHKSFRRMKEGLDLLLNELNFSKEKIRANGFLLHSNVKNTKRILDEVPVIGDVPIKEVLLKQPKILMANVDTIKEILEIYKENNISSESIKKCYTLLTLSPKSVKDRFAENKSIPHLNAFSDNSQILKLINSQRKVKHRISFLESLQMKNISLNVLSGTEANFERYINEGIDRTRGDDIVNYLDAKFKSSISIRQELTKHHYWFHVPITQVAETYTFLSKNYKAEDLIQILQIFLYPKEKIEFALENVKNNPDFIKKKISSLEELNLCLYYVEKPHHFTGNGIWLNEEAKERAINE